jgi:protein transport protein SEC23
MDIYQSEESDGVRMPWNILPINKGWADKIVLPVGVHYTPGKQIADIEFLGDQPLLCSLCAAVFNPFCLLDKNTKTYLCPICGARSSLPQNKLKYLNEYQTLPELSPSSTTIEYQLDEKVRERGFLFVVDKCVPEDELTEIKIAIKGQLEQMPDDCYVGLITFDRNVFVQDLAETEFLSEFAFNGSKDYSLDKIAGMLQFPLPAAQALNFKPGAHHLTIFNKLEHCRDLFERAVDKITIDKWHTSSVERPARASGAALKVAMTIAAGWFQHVALFHQGNADRSLYRRTLHIRTWSYYSQKQRDFPKVS